MAKVQGDVFRTWTDVEMNKRVADHREKWNRQIKPYYDSLVNEQEKEFKVPLDYTDEVEIFIRTRQYNEVQCTGKTRFWLGTLNKEDYKIVNTVYIVTSVMVNKETGENTYLGHRVFEGKENREKANEYFKELRKALRS